MGNHKRSFGERAGRAVIIGIGALGALAAVDALLLFFFLLIAPVFVAATNPYIGLVMFIAVPLTVVVGGALAWAGYSTFMEPSEEPQAEGPPVERPVSDGQHAHP